jgi:hypothetical protein
MKISENFATNKLKIQKKQLSAAIAIALMLTLAATFITALPITLGQAVTTPIAKITMSGNLWEGPCISGINQNVFIQTVVSPMPLGYSQDQSKSAGNIYKNLTFTITKPDKTTDKVTMDTDNRSECWFWYNCTQLGVYSVSRYFPGDADHSSLTTGPMSWQVQAQPVTPLTPIPVLTYLVSPPTQIMGGIFYDFTFTVTKPDGTTYTHTMDTDSVATAEINMVMDQVGTWSVKFSYPGSVATRGAPLFQSAVSAVTTWNVQTEPIPTYQDVPLPTGPWKFPISGEY